MPRESGHPVTLGMCDSKPEWFRSPIPVITGPPAFAGDDNRGAGAPMRPGRRPQMPSSSLSVRAVEVIDCTLVRSSALFFEVEKPWPVPL
jgi:hypothetical protein